MIEGIVQALCELFAESAKTRDEDAIVMASRDLQVVLAFRSLGAEHDGPAAHTGVLGRTCGQRHGFALDENQS